METPDYTHEDEVVLRKMGYQKSICSRCAGKGVVGNLIGRHSDDCPQCNGRGDVWVEPRRE